MRKVLLEVTREDAEMQSIKASGASIKAISKPWA